MIRWIWTGALILLLAVAGGCQKPVSDEDAIRASIDKHLSESQVMNMAAMDKNIRQMTIVGDRANVRVEFRLKDGDAHMMIEYMMGREDGGWKVLSSHPMTGQDQQPGIPGGAPGGGTQ